jgi:hypothetical protein
VASGEHIQLTTSHQPPITNHPFPVETTPDDDS